MEGGGGGKGAIGMHCAHSNMVCLYVFVPLTLQLPL